jgi:hypothetical protein
MLMYCRDVQNNVVDVFEQIEQQMMVMYFAAANAAL